MNLVSFLLGILVGALSIIIIASISAYQQEKLARERIQTTIESLAKAAEQTKKTTRKTIKKGE